MYWLYTGLSPISPRPGNLKAQPGSEPRSTGLPGTTVPISPNSRTGSNRLNVITERIWSMTR